VGAFERGTPVMSCFVLQRYFAHKDPPTPHVVLCITLASSLTLTYHS
jgi:hypothetical protein